MQAFKKALRTRLNVARMFLRDSNGFRVIRHVKRNHLTYLETSALLELYQRVRDVEGQQREGMLLEAGCALGGSALVMATGKEPARPLHIFDAFGMIPPPSEHDGDDAHQRYNEISGGHAAGIDGNQYYGYENGLLERVQANFVDYGFDLDRDNIRFVKGLYENTLAVDAPVALAHIDCDWYDSVITCLERIVPYLVPQGVLVIDDYHTWSGCKKAVDTYFAGQDAYFEFEMKSRLHITRKR